MTYYEDRQQCNMSTYHDTPMHVLRASYRPHVLRGEEHDDRQSNAEESRHDRCCLLQPACVGWPTWHAGCNIERVDGEGLLWIHLPILRVDTVCDRSLRLRGKAKLSQFRIVEPLYTRRIIWEELAILLLAFPFVDDVLELDWPPEQPECIMGLARSRRREHNQKWGLECSRHREHNL